MNTCGIYGIRNMVSGKWYVGQSLNVEQRIRQHKADLRYKHHFNDHLQKAVIKYGLKNFAFRILEETPESMLDVRECAWIEYHKSIDQKYGYNQSTGGHLTRHHSKESLRKMSKSQKGRHHSKETRRRMSEANKRRPPPSEETCRKISLSKKGKASLRPGYKHSSETRKKMSVAQKGRIFSEEHRAKLSVLKKGKPWSEARRAIQEYKKI